MQGRRDEVDVDESATGTFYDAQSAKHILGLP